MMASEATKICRWIIMSNKIFYWWAFLGLLPLEKPVQLLGQDHRTKRNKNMHPTPERLKKLHCARQLTFQVGLILFKSMYMETVRDNLGRQNVASVEGSWPACNPREGWLATRTVSSEAARQLAVLPPPSLLMSLYYMSGSGMTPPSVIRSSDKHCYLQPEIATISTEV